MVEKQKTMPSHPFVYESPEEYFKQKPWLKEVLVEEFGRNLAEYLNDTEEGREIRYELYKSYCEARDRQSLHFDDWVKTLVSEQMKRTLKEEERLKNMMGLLLSIKFGRIDRMSSQRKAMLKIFDDFFPEAKEWFTELREELEKEGK